MSHHITQREGIFLISYRHAEINDVIINSYIRWSVPHVQHQYCLRHVACNFNDIFGNKILKDVAYRARVQYQPQKFECYMEQLKQLYANSVT